MNNLLADALLPPLNLLLLATFGALVARWRPRLGRLLLIVSLASAYLASTSAISGSCLRYLERSVPAATPATLDTLPAVPGVIVVLGGGSYHDAPEYGVDTVSQTTLVRLRWAARLYRELHVPVLVSGGNPAGTANSEAEQMRDALVQDFAVPVQWVESVSRDTYESAFNTWKLLGRQHRQIILVTHAAHMPRAMMIFRKVGFEVTPAATGYTTATPGSIRDFIPSAAGLGKSRTFLHEIIGLGWYHLRLTMNW
jgi:uncharacterized SAM-binding protein YcdF (DUF218 family)